MFGTENVPFGIILWRAAPPLVAHMIGVGVEPEFWFKRPFLELGFGHAALAILHGPQHSGLVFEGPWAIFEGFWANFWASLGG